MIDWLKIGRLVEDWLGIGGLILDCPIGTGLTSDWQIGLGLTYRSGIGGNSLKMDCMDRSVPNSTCSFDSVGDRTGIGLVLA